VAAADNIDTIERLYAAMDRHDGEAMAACYAPDATFSDPVFAGLADGEPQDMWRMLVGRSGDMTVELVEQGAEGEDRGTARWIARYTFGQTGRPVVNDVRSQFRFDSDGLIVEQLDEFDFWRWARQALGPVGLLAGWTPVLQHSVRDKARARLAAFRDR
jgi:ketosteroid isomerase-like protein